MRDPHPDTVDKLQWMVTGVLVFHAAAAVLGWLVMRLAGYEQINLHLVITP